MVIISKHIRIPDSEIRIDAVRAQGPGGQNVNKVSSAVHLRFDIAASSLPDEIKGKLRDLKDRRISKSGVVVIKAQRFRTQEKNREDALERLKALISRVLIRSKKRKSTKPTRASQQKRLESKARKGRTKRLRGRVSPDD